MKRRTFLETSALCAAGVTSGLMGCSLKNGVEYRTLGRTGIQVSLLGFGSHLTGENRQNPDRRDKQIQHGIERGINLFDIYEHSYGQFGPMAESLSGKRKDAVISLVSVEEDSKKEVEGALKTFNTDYIDLYRAVSTDPKKTDPLFEFKEQGKIRAVGIVAHYEEIFLDHLEKYDFDYVMIPYNFHHNSAGTSGDGTSFEKLMWRVKEKNIGVLAMKPMGSAAMIKLAREEKLMGDNSNSPSIPKAMLRYIYENPVIASSIPAMNSIGEIDENCDSLTRTYPDDDEREALIKLSKLAFETKSAYLPGHYKWLERWAV